MELDGEEFKETYLSNDYLISRTGRVYSVRNKIFLRFCINNRNYYTVRLYVNKKSKQIAVHRLVGVAFLDISPIDRTDINHIDGNKKNNNITNLEWTNDSLNEKHAYKIGIKDRTIYQGENNVTSKLTDNEVYEIIEKRKQGLLLTDIAEQYNMSISQISKIAKRQVWKHLF